METSTDTNTTAEVPFHKMITAHKGYGENTPRRVAALMPLYVREKISALKIDELVDSLKESDGTVGAAAEIPTPAEGSKYLMFEKRGYDPVCVNKEYMDTFHPEAGGYFTVDAVSGNHGYIPGEEFERKFQAL